MWKQVIFFLYSYISVCCVFSGVFIFDSFMVWLALVCFVELSQHFIAALVRAGNELFNSCRAARWLFWPHHECHCVIVILSPCS